jgi:ABC-type branched-subunit amino acid transport system substrate-binding protein
MHTMKLLAIQQPSRLETLLESLVANQNWVPPDARPITDHSELSSALQKLAIKVANSEGAWRAWASYDGVRLFIAEMSLELSRERGCPVLQVSYYTDAGRLQLYSLWVQPADGGWRQCTL